MEQKRRILAELYSEKWVAKKSDAQVIAIYMRLKQKGKISV